MSALKGFLKRNTPVFVLGLCILIIFGVIILSTPNSEKKFPAGFKKVEEQVFNEREPTEPAPDEQSVEYAPQIPSVENKGKPYFYGEKNPSLRDAEGYPTPPSPDTIPIPKSMDPEEQANLRESVEYNYNIRTTPVIIKFSEKGFEPTEATAYTGQKIEWQNTTKEGIKIIQTIAIHEALKNGITISPGQSLVFRPLVTGVFKYLETGSGKYGAITVMDSTAPLQ